MVARNIILKHHLKSYLFSLTREAKMLFGLARRLCGESDSAISPSDRTMMRSHFRIVATRCWNQEFKRHYIGLFILLYVISTVINAGNIKIFQRRKLQNFLISVIYTPCHQGLGKQRVTSTLQHSQQWWWQFYHEKLFELLVVWLHQFPCQ